MTTKRKTTVRKNGKTLHGAAAEAVLRAREKRAKKKRPNGVGSTISTTVRALHEAARGVMKATMDNPARKEQLFYVDTYRGRELESQGALMAASQKQAISRTKRAYREAGDDPRKYRFKAYADNPGMFSGGNARRVSARDFMRGARVRVKGSKKELTIDTPIRSGGVVVAYKLSNGALVEPRDLQVLNPTGRPTVNRPPQRSNSAERDAQHPNLV